MTTIYFSLSIRCDLSRDGHMDHKELADFLMSSVSYSKSLSKEGCVAFMIAIDYFRQLFLVTKKQLQR